MQEITVKLRSISDNITSLFKKLTRVKGQITLKRLITEIITIKVILWPYAALFPKLLRIIKEQVTSKSVLKTMV